MVSTLATIRQRRENYRENVRCVFGATADLYYSHWGEFFHFAIFEDDDAPSDFTGALERTHERYFSAIRGSECRHILELATGGGAFAAWMAQRTSGEVVGVDISDVQLARAHARVAAGGYHNLRFIEHDIMHLDELDVQPFDAAIFLDAACYLPDKQEALRAIGTRLRPGARLLLVDWCRSEDATDLQEELILEPFYRAWAIPEMETISGYRQAFDSAGFTLLAVEDQSSRVTPNWERAYRAAISAVAEPLKATQLVALAAKAMRYGPEGMRLAKEQFQAALLAKAGADSGVIRYVSFLAARE